MFPFIGNSNAPAGADTAPLGQVDGVAYPGDVVMYVLDGPVPVSGTARPAVVIVAAPDATVDLWVFADPRDGQSYGAPTFRGSVPHSATPLPYTWHFIGEDAPAPMTATGGQVGGPA